MAMNQFFRCFCINRFGLGSLHYLSSRSDFGFEFSEIFVFEYAESATPRIGDSGELFFEYEYLREFKAEIGTAREVV
jgi:hypothetical protein